MVSVYDLKPRFQALLRPLCRALAGAGVTANAVTVAAALLSIAAGYTLVHFAPDRRLLFLLPVILFVRMALNAIDGMLAREFNQKSNLGAILNELGDVVSDAAIYLPLALWFGWPIMSVIVALAIMTEMTGIVAVQIGATRRYDGPMGKSDRAFVFGTITLALGCGAPIGLWLRIMLYVIMALLGVTIINRARRALGEVKP